MHASFKRPLRAQAHSDQNGSNSSAQQVPAHQNGSQPAQQQRSVILLPGLGNNSQDYAPMADTLRQRGLHVQTAAVARADWYLAALTKVPGCASEVGQSEPAALEHGLDSVSPALTGLLCLYTQVAQRCRSQAKGILDRQAAAPARGGLVLPLTHPATPTLPHCSVHHDSLSVASTDPDVGMHGRYLEKVDAAVKAAQEATGGGPITLVAHSAGGWLGRVYMLVRALCNCCASMEPQWVPAQCGTIQLPYGKLLEGCGFQAMCCWQGYGTDGIDRMVTLGSPHKAPPKASISPSPLLPWAAHSPAHDVPDNTLCRGAG